MNVMPSGAIESVLNYGEFASRPDRWSGTGVVLSRNATGDGDLRLGLFLKNLGLFHVNVPGAEYYGKNGPRFGGSTEPFVWGKFKLRRSQRTHIFYIEDIYVTDDVYALRCCSKALLTVNRWAYLIKTRLPWGQVFDELLANLYWSMKLLEKTKSFAACADITDIMCGVINWRFLWRWLKLSGLAPVLRHCDGYNELVYKLGCPLLNLQSVCDGEGCGDCLLCLLRQASAIELEFLGLVALLNLNPVAEILTDLGQKFCGLDGLPAYITDLFKRASQWAEKILTLYTV